MAASAKSLGRTKHVAKIYSPVDLSDHSIDMFALKPYAETLREGACLPYSFTDATMQQVSPW